ncbi:hypothetical protein PFDG_04867 [Plasmodium falciparum Dd2]|nr:hypothetical protein PFDG_04867 [Plasmodium falciparum Dd2]
MHNVNEKEEVPKIDRTKINTRRASVSEINENVEETKKDIPQNENYKHLTDEENKVEKEMSIHDGMKGQKYGSKNVRSFSSQGIREDFPYKNENNHKMHNVNEKEEVPKIDRTKINTRRASVSEINENVEETKKDIPQNKNYKHLTDEENKVEKEMSIHDGMKGQKYGSKNIRSFSSQGIREDFPYKNENNHKMHNVNEKEEVPK